MLRNTLAAMVVFVLVVGGAAVTRAQYGSAPEAPKPGAATLSGEVKKPLEKTKTFSGTVKSMEATRLVVQGSGKAPKEYAFELAGTAIKVGKKEGTSTDLKVGDSVRVTYTESEGKLIAKTVVAKPAKTRK